MEFAIIAAGEGSRLAAEGMKVPKPLVQLQQQPLIERLLRQFMQQGATKIHVVINEYSPDVAKVLTALGAEMPLNIIRKTTPSSLHSFQEIVDRVEGDRVCLTTVDTVFDSSEFAAYLDAFQKDEASDALMAVTGFVDDESPLYIAAGVDGRINRYADRKEADCNFVSGGIYCIKRNAFGVVNETVASGIHRMRNFQRRLVEEGYVVKAFEFSKIVDIDHVADIQTAETWLAELEGRLTHQL